MQSSEKFRTIVFFKNYFEDFFLAQNEKVKEKIIWTLTLVEELERIPEIYLKHIENSDGLYEIRVKLGSNIYRIFCFFEDNKIIIVGNGFQKKTQKTPKSEIDKTLKIKQEYENERK